MNLSLVAATFCLRASNVAGVVAGLSVPLWPWGDLQSPICTPVFLSVSSSLSLSSSSVAALWSFCLGWPPV